MAERFDVLILAGAIILVLAVTTCPATARVQEYRIVRLVTLKSGCRIEHLADQSPAAGPMRFLATCENVTFYPEGVAVLCDDRDDDRSCRILTQPMRFDSLDLLRR